jgi:hypothetical protein
LVRKQDDELFADLILKHGPRYSVLMYRLHTNATIWRLAKNYLAVSLAHALATRTWAINYLAAPSCRLAYPGPGERLRFLKVSLAIWKWGMCIRAYTVCAWEPKHCAVACLLGFLPTFGLGWAAGVS